MMAKHWILAFAAMWLSKDPDRIAKESYSFVIFQRWLGHSPLFVCFVALCTKSTAMVMAGRLVDLTTIFPGQAWECRTNHPATKHPMPLFATPDKTSRINLPLWTKHPMQFLSPRTKHPMPFLPPRTKHPTLLLPPRTKHPTLCLKPMKVHKTSHLLN